MGKWMMIGNPKSASASTGDAWNKSVEKLTKAGLEVEVAATERAGHAIELAKDAAAKGFRKFIAAGGDGTVHEVLTGLLRYADESKTSLTDFTLAALPYGTGNDWIRTPGIPEDVDKAADCIIAGKTIKEDVVRMTFPQGVFAMANIGGIGVDADICIRTNRLKEKGRKGGFLYTMVAPLATLSRKRHPVEVTLDGEVAYTGKLFTATLGNGAYRGGGLIQTAQDTKWDDGLLDITLMPGYNHIKGLMLMLHCVSGDLAVQPGMITKRFKKMTVKPLGKVADPVEVDGEIPGTLPLTMEVTGEQINVIAG
ncbi:MAG: diacylglycerol kinase family lipid kinase [Bacteroidales bacterium]|nr:diacylglycerol kinase family lipid kinase [Bacteroidales bacterium]